MYGRREKRGGKRDYKGGGKWKNKGEIAQHCAIFHNRKKCKEAEANKIRREPGLKATGSGRFNPPPSDLEL